MKQIDINDPITKNEIQEMELPFLRDVYLNLKGADYEKFNKMFNLRDYPKSKKSNPIYDDFLNPVYESNPIFEEINPRYEYEPLYEFSQAYESNPIYEEEL